MLDHRSRKEAASARGKMDYIVGTNVGSKYEKANSPGAPILDKA
ncbi:MAG TPA: hypothetical protein VJK29_01245 [Terriglobales bacterium]|nr:hypothetical protein [Terriglobales bacterium]